MWQLKNILLQHLRQRRSLSAQVYRNTHQFTNFAHRLFMFHQVFH